MLMDPCGPRCSTRRLVPGFGGGRMNQQVGGMFAIALAWHGAGLLSLIAVCVQGEWGWHEPKPLGHVELRSSGPLEVPKKDPKGRRPNCPFRPGVRNAVLASPSDIHTL